MDTLLDKPNSLIILRSVSNSFRCSMDEKSGNHLEVDSSLAKRPFWKSIRNYFREYCVCSNIHGFRYFGEKRTHFERVWWFIVFSITFGICVYFIREVYKKWERTPVIVSFATAETPIYEIPFPAVTICPESDKFNHTEIYKKYMLNQTVTDEEHKVYDYMSSICTSSWDIANRKKNLTFEEDFFDVLKNVSLKWHDIFLNCQYMGENRNCSDLFKPVITDEGVCFTFNMMDRSEIYKPNTMFFEDFFSTNRTTGDQWSIEYGYNKTNKHKVHSYPRRALFSGTKYGLSVTLRTKKTWMDHTCKDAIQGYKTMLHIPVRVPLFRQQYFQVPLDQQVVAAIQPVMMSTSNSVKLYNPKRRKCFFPSEKSLKFFKIYTSLNCKLECLANFTLAECGCVTFYMPRTNDTYLCGIGQMQCIKKAESQLQMGTLYEYMYPDEKIKKFRRSRKVCNCLPICTDLSYDVETSQTDWNWRQWFKTVVKPEFQKAENNLHLSRLTIFFKSTHFISSQRHELYGPVDFLANFGGLLGLFMGFSVLSLMEIIYFVTVRLFCNIRLYGYWAGPEI